MPTRRLVRARVLLTAAALTAAAATPCAASGTAAPAPDGPITTAVSRTGQFLTDPSGRTVEFHGFNLIRKLAPYYPSTITAADARFLADEGFTIVRLGFIWTAAEPSPGVYDDAYINKIIDLADLMGTYGVRTLLDFHQDSWGESNGGDGAPAWASLAPVTGEAAIYDDWQDFWDNDAAPDGVGIQTHFVNLWKHIAPMISGNTNIMGINPINEPSPGAASGCTALTFCPTWAANTLFPFYNKIIAAVRTVDTQHVFFPEINPLHSNPDTGAVSSATIGLPAFTDKQTAFNFHSYCLDTEGSANGRSGTGTADATACATSDSQSVNGYTTYASQIGVPAILSEFSATSDSGDNETMLDLADSHSLTWTSWAYTYFKGDPADASSDGVFNDFTGPPTEANGNQTKLSDYDVPYAQAIAGTPTSYSYDRTARVMTLDYSTTEASGAAAPAGAETQIFVPQRHYETGYVVAVTGGHVVSRPTAPWLEIVNDPGVSAVTVTVSPTTGSSTLRPLETDAFGAVATVPATPTETAAGQAVPPPVTKAKTRAARRNLRPATHRSVAAPSGTLAYTGTDPLAPVIAAALLAVGLALKRRRTRG